MPWSHCSASSIADDEDCPECGISKAAWTVEFNRTRTFQVGRRTQRRQKQSWVGLTLVRGEDPVPGADYELELPDGRVVRGRLEDDGTLRCEGLYPGECLVRFPERRVQLRGEDGQSFAPDEEGWLPLDTDQEHRLELADAPNLGTSAPAQTTPTPTPARPAFVRVHLRRQGPGTPDAVERAGVILTQGQLLWPLETQFPAAEGGGLRYGDYPSLRPDGTFYGLDGVVRNGTQRVPANEIKMVYVESRGRFSCSLPLAFQPATWQINGTQQVDLATVTATQVQPWKHERKLLPRRVELLPGRDRNNWRPGAGPYWCDRNTPANFAGVAFVQGRWSNFRSLGSLLRAPTARGVSLGSGGDLLLEFDPIFAKRGETLLEVLEFQPGEAFDYALGSTRAEALGTTYLLNAPAGRTTTGTSLTPNVDPPRPVRWVRIRDRAGAGQPQPIDQPGIDIRRVLAHSRRGAVVILLDVSGSMSNDLARSKQKAAADQEKRLYVLAAKALRDTFLNGLPEHLVNLSLFVFHGSPSAKPAELSHARKVRQKQGWSSDPAPLRVSLTQLENGQDAVPYYHYTPIASALRRGAQALREVPAAFKLMILVSDGEGTGPKGEQDSEGTGPTDKEDAEGTKAKSKKSVASQLRERFEDTGPLNFSATGDPKGMRAHLEIVGFRVQDSERLKMHQYRAPGNWHTEHQEAFTVDNLESLFRKLRRKYGLNP